MTCPRNANPRPPLPRPTYKEHRHDPPIARARCSRRQCPSSRPRSLPRRPARELRHRRRTPRRPSPRSEQREIEALTRQLQEVQDALKDWRMRIARSSASRTSSSGRWRRNPRRPRHAAAYAGRAKSRVPPNSGPPSRRCRPFRRWRSTRTGSPFGNLKLWGYGELYYTRPTHDAKEAQADLARAVFGIGYTFDEPHGVQFRIRGGACGRIRDRSRRVRGGAVLHRPAAERCRGACAPDCS